MPDSREFESIRKSLGLGRLPLALRIVVTAFVLLLAVGHLAALREHWIAYAATDGVPSLSYQDLRRSLHGEMPPPREVSITDSPMWVKSHDTMRRYYRDDTDFGIAEAWMLAGAPESTYDWPWRLTHAGSEPLSAAEIAADEALADDSRFRTPARIFNDGCVVCHGPGGAFAQGPMNTFAGVKKLTAPPEILTPDPPPTADELARFAHAHLLTIPVFVLLLGVLYYLANWPAGSPTAQAMITALPMVALTTDASLTWLVRATDWLVIPLLATRAVFLLGILMQTVCTLGGLWQKE